MRHGTCIHFTGLRDTKECCGAGVNYHAAFGDKRPGLFLRMPCIAFHERPANRRGTLVRPGEATVREEVDRKGETVIECPHRVEPTDEQVEQSRIESKAAMDSTMAALVVAGQWRTRPKPAQNRAEVVECPVCKGSLHLHQSAYNGHVHGQCETAGCVAWME